MKRMVLAGLVLAGVFGVIASAPQATAEPVDCSLVRCEACPAGTQPAPTPNDCCRCK